eukprot:3996116-Prymnesium_polylepis.2
MAVGFVPFDLSRQLRRRHHEIAPGHSLPEVAQGAQRGHLSRIRGEGARVENVPAQVVVIPACACDASHVDIALRVGRAAGVGAGAAARKVTAV